MRWIISQAIEPDMEIVFFNFLALGLLIGVALLVLSLVALTVFRQWRLQSRYNQVLERNLEHMDEVESLLQQMLEALDQRFDAP